MIVKLLTDFAGGFLGGIGKKVGSWFPDKDQSILLEKKNLKRELHELEKRTPLSFDDNLRLRIILERLREIEEYHETRQR